MKIEKLTGAYKDYIWGGDRLPRLYGKRTDLRPVAESWELSFHKDGLSTLSDGRELARAVTDEMLGCNLSDFSEFPVLVKLIDAKDNLSVQVHPSDEYAREHEGQLGKTEMWYVVDADEGAGIYLGFCRDVTKDEVLSAIREERLTELMNFYPVRAGESYFIPAGTIHAIGRGTLICEVQQSSNVTYRVYDYGRRDKNGNQRPLHVDKALEVLSFKEFKKAEYDSDLLGACRYFSARKVTVSGSKSIPRDEGSFLSLCCTAGEGRVDGVGFSAGDSFFVPAGCGDLTVEGNGEFIMTEVRKYYVGIDLGGTFIKGGIVDDLGRIIVSDKVPTEAEMGEGRVAENIANLAKKLLVSAGLKTEDVVGLGLGVPGMIDSAQGLVVYSNNLRWENFYIADAVSRLTGLEVRIANDANVAALGEARFGGGKNLKNTVMLTLGTGVGGGMVLDGRLYEGNRSAGAEMGHTVIMAGGERCSCGRRGCLEAYASATALIRDTKRAMEADPDSLMWEIGSTDKVNGKTAFDYKDKDKSARAVVDNYIMMLGCGIANIANELRPEAVILGGGVCAQGDELINPLKELLKTEIYAGDRGPNVDIVVASLGNEAGLLGAAALFM